MSTDLTEYTRKIGVCVHCPKKVMDGNYALCSLDRKNIVKHVEEIGCPKGFFEPGKAPAAPMLMGDMVAALAKKVGADRAANFMARMMGKKDCGCAARQAWLNRLQAWLKRQC